MVIGTTPTFEVIFEDFAISRAASIIFYFTQGKDDVRICKRFDMPVVEDREFEDGEEKTYHPVVEDDYWRRYLSQYLYVTGSEFQLDLYNNSISVMLSQLETLRFKPNSVMNWGVIVIPEDERKWAYDLKTDTETYVADSFPVFRLETPIFTEDVEAGIYGGVITAPADIKALP